MYKEIKRVFSAKCLKAELQVLLFQTKQICLSTFSARQVGGGTGEAELRAEKA